MVNKVQDIYKIHSYIHQSIFNCYKITAFKTLQGHSHTLVLKLEHELQYIYISGFPMNIKQRCTPKVREIISDVVIQYIHS